MTSRTTQRSTQIPLFPSLIGGAGEGGQAVLHPKDAVGPIKAFTQKHPLRLGLSALLAALGPRKGEGLASTAASGSV